MAFQGASSSSRSSSTRWSTYDVFLSFRGKDTRQHFTAHLRHALGRKNIYTYIDYKLPRGEEISDELLKAIESSRISIVVLSKNYASSRWCLDELMKILECKKTKQQKVLPVFYDVDPTEVRNQREVFGKALAELKERFKDESKVKRWKAALTEVAGLSGFTLGERTEAELIQEIVREVSKLVKPKYINNVAEHPVGMESRVQGVHDILLRVGVNDTRILGIYGTGGIGKTTLAKEIYNTFTDQFENCCFLENVRETSKSEDGLIKLQETLLCMILGDWSLKVRNVDEGMGLIKKMLWSKKVLLVLDDLDKSVKVKTLLGGCDHLFGLGSIIIITTRDEHLLTTYNVHLRYKVEELARDEALQLFRWNAFKKENPNHEFLEITENVLDYVGGLPLALTVIGSDLCGRDIHYWRSALEKYKRIPHKDIFEMLKISYDGLDESEKNIFLDIACFFTGKHKAYVTVVLDGCGFFATCGIKVLVDKSLITINVWGILIMHDLLKDMGREIVRQESSKEPEKRSRLWFHEDVRRVLEEPEGTNTIEAILLDFSEGHDHMICLHPKAFKKMKNLRLLFINRNAQFSGGPPNYLSNEIRVFDWPEYPWSFLPSNFHGTKLIEFRMRNSLIKELGGLKSENLTKMDLSGCKSLTKIISLSSCPNLERLYLGNCENLVEIHDFELRMPNSLITFKNLRVMNFSGCKSLTKIPDLSSCPNLKELDLSNCENLVEIHDSVKLRMPNSLITFKNLRVMNFSGCKSLTKIPDLSSCPNLKELDLFNCENLVEVHDSVKLPMPNSLITFKNLRVMNFSGCKSLTKIPDLSSCPNLKELYLFNCENLVEVHDSVKLPMPNSLITFKNLTVMFLSGCKSLTKIPDLSSFPNLERLYLRNCGNLVEVHDSVKLRMPNSLITFKNLTVMILSDCKSLTKIPDLSSCPNLKELDLSNCENLVEIHDSVKLRMPNSLITFKNLTVMNFSGCKFFTKILDLSSFPYLERLDLSNCENLVEVHDSVELRMPNSLITFKNLTYMYLSDCKFLTKIPDLSRCPYLKRLDLSNCENLVEVHDSVELRMPNSLITFENLIYMNLSGCKSLTKILAPSSCPNLEMLDLSHCTSLESFALLSEILIKNNGRKFSNFGLRIDLYGCHKLLANMMRSIPSWEEEQNWAKPLKRERDIDIIFPGKRIPNWFSYRNEAHDVNLFQIDIKPPHHYYGILLYVVFGFRVGIIDPITDDASISVVIHDGSDKEELFTTVMTDSWMDSDHVWMYGKCYRPDKQTVSRVTFKCKSKLVVFRRIGIHFLRLGSKFHYCSSDEEIDSSLDLMDEQRHSSILELDNDDENPKEDLELENDDENLKEIFG